MNRTRRGSRAFMRSAAAIVALPCASVVCSTPPAMAVPGPEIEYVYNVIVRRHFDFPNNDAIGYGYHLCDTLRNGQGYPQLMDDVKRDVFPNDEQAANYVVSNAIGILCPAQIWQLRHSAAGYQPPPA